MIQKCTLCRICSSYSKGCTMYKNSLAGNNLIIPGHGEFVKWHPGWGRENRLPFLQCELLDFGVQRAPLHPPQSHRPSTVSIYTKMLSHFVNCIPANRMTYLIPKQNYLKKTIQNFWALGSCVVHVWGPYTDKKENKIFLIYREIQMGSGAKSYMRKGFLIY